MDTALDNPAWWALAGPQRALGTATALSARFDAEVSPFGAFPGEPTESHWRDLAGLVGPGGLVVPIGSGATLLRPPDGWTVEREIPGVQLVGDRMEWRPGGDGDVGPGEGRAGRAGEVPVTLDADDADAILELVALAQPGPFLSRTIEFGGYVGIRRQGRLVAMAGERLRPPGYAEVSAVATHPDHRRQGLAELLVRAVAGAIMRRGEIPFLHAAAANTSAIRLYESMGFTRRTTVSFVLARAPDGPERPS